MVERTGALLVLGYSRRDREEGGGCCGEPVHSSWCSGWGGVEQERHWCQGRDFCRTSGWTKGLCDTEVSPSLSFQCPPPHPTIPKSAAGRSTIARPTELPAYPTQPSHLPLSHLHRPRTQSKAIPQVSCWGLPLFLEIRNSDVTRAKKAPSLVTSHLLLCVRAGHSLRG